MPSSHPNDLVDMRLLLPVKQASALEAAAVRFDFGRRTGKKPKKANPLFPASTPITDALPLEPK
jgi:hypothetical protein